MNLRCDFNRSIVVSLIVVIATAGSLIAQSNDRDVLRERIEWLSSTPNPSVDGAPIAAVVGITKLYERRGYEPAWTDPAMVAELFDQVLRSVEHGLDPEVDPTSFRDKWVIIGSSSDMLISESSSSSTRCMPP